MGHARLDYALLNPTAVVFHLIIKTIRRLESLGQHKTSDAESSD